MTAPTSAEPALDPQGIETAGDDQRPHDFRYGHGRMPLLMKLAWLGFLAFGAWYVVVYLLAALAQEVG
ncbi:MAG TPA: hypothetical protein VEI02_08265 [Planctomycetota bacterium]|nr:hypothetical protein [Planctomycetota bacterium]